MGTSDAPHGWRGRERLSWRRWRTWQHRCGLTDRRNTCSCSTERGQRLAAATNRRKPSTRPLGDPWIISRTNHEAEMDAVCEPCFFTMREREILVGDVITREEKAPKVTRRRRGPPRSPRRRERRHQAPRQMRHHPPPRSSVASIPSRRPRNRRRSCPESTNRRRS